MLNVPLLRRAQQSISDTSVPFDMTQWSCCIAGHVMRAAGHDPIVLASIYNPAHHAAALIGISYDEAVPIFSALHNRYTAVKRLEKLIEEHTAREAQAQEAQAEGLLQGAQAEGLLGKSRSRVSYLTTPAESPYWHGQPPTVEVDFSAIDAILHEAKEQEPELVGV